MFPNPDVWRQEACAQAEPIGLAEFTISLQVVLHKLQPAWDASGCE